MEPEGLRTCTLLVLLLLGFAAPAVQQQQQSDHASQNEQLKACLDDGFQFKRTSWNTSIDNDSPAK